MNTTIDKELLFRYFAGQLTPFQVRMVEEWLNDSTHTELFYESLATWEGRNLQFVADTRLAHDRHRVRFMTKVMVVEPLHSPRPQHSFFRRSYWLAASMLFALLMGGYQFRDTLLNQTYQTGYGETRSFRLADGSQVTLNANSSLRLPRFGFGQHSREVRLEGEATFAVTHLPNHERFVVRTNHNLDVVVLGTEFTVYARERGARVTLEKGKVQLRYPQGRRVQNVFMKPGEVASFNREGIPTLKTVAEPEKLSAWRENRFVFEETSLQELVYLLKENFGLEVSIPDSTLSLQTVSGSFTAQSAEEMLHLLSETSGLRFEKNGKQITITAQ
jgi:transmembrane sensor